MYDGHLVLWLAGSVLSPDCNDIASKTVLGFFPRQENSQNGKFNDSLPR